MAHIYPTRRRAGFTLIEATVSTLLVGMVVVGALHVYGSSLSMAQARVGRNTSGDVMESLVAEITQKYYADPDGGTVFGREADELLIDRRTWDDVDDFHGLLGAPSGVDGTPLAGFESWTWSVTVRHVDPITLAELSDVSDQGLKRISVNLVAPTGEAWDTVILRTSHSPFDHRMEFDREFSSGVQATVVSSSLEETSIRILSLNDPAVVVNVLRNSGFESGIQHWDGQGASLQVRTDGPVAGSQYVHVTGRPAEWAGIGQGFLIEQGKKYRIEAWIKTVVDEPVRVEIVMSTSHGYQYEFATVSGVAGQWTRASAVLQASWSGTLWSATAEVRPQNGTNDYSVDEFTCQEVPE